MLDLSKLQAGKVEFESLPLDLAAPARGKHDAVCRRRRGQGHRADRVAAAERRRTRCWAIRLRIRQIVLNLVGNAVKFTFQGEVVVKADVVAGDGGRATLEIAVSDTGVGMEPATIEKIFEPFTQADESTTRRFGGTGLGLAICRELTERMGGAVTVESRPNVGSTFRMTVPLGVAVTPTAVAPPAPFAPRTAWIFTRRPALAESLLRHTRALGLNARFCESDAWGFAREDLLIVDLSTHAALVESLFQDAHTARPPPVILATAAQLETLACRGQIDDELIVAKPVQREALSNALRAAAGERRAGNRQGETENGPPIGAHVLLVEDEAVNAAVAQGYLAELGCTCVWVDNGTEAVARSATERFDMIMMDLNMPDMDGLATARLMREREGTGPHVPIVALTAHEATSYRDPCLAAGMNDVMGKPYTLGECARLLQRWLSRSATPAREPEHAASSSARSDAVTPQGRPLVDSATVTALKNLRAADQPDLYSRLVGLFETGSTQAMSEIDSALARDDLAGASAVCHKLAASAANVGALTFAHQTRSLEEALQARARDTGRLLVRSHACRPPGADRRAVASLPRGERMSSLPTQPIAIIADDEDLGRLLLAETAVASGLSPLSFDNGVAALEAALSQDVAIVLLDVDMPGMDGYTVCRRLRADPRFATVPIVMVTGHEDSAAISSRVRRRRHRFHLEAGQLGAPAATPGLHPAQCGGGRAHRAARLFRHADRTAEPAALHRYRRAAVRRCGDRRSRQVAVIYVDLNSFKRVNDTFGHSVGDAVLKNVAGKLARAVVALSSGATDAVSVARFGGDEFVVLVAMPRRSVALEIASACAAACQRSDRPRGPRVLFRAEHRHRRLPRRRPGRRDGAQACRHGHVPGQGRRVRLDRDVHRRHERAAAGLARPRGPAAARGAGGSAAAALSAQVPPERPPLGGGRGFAALVRRGAWRHSARPDSSRSPRTAV